MLEQNQLNNFENETEEWVVMRGLNNPVQNYLMERNDGEFDWTGDKNKAIVFSYERAEQLSRYYGGCAFRYLDIAK